MTVKGPVGVPGQVSAKTDPGALTSLSFKSEQDPKSSQDRTLGEISKPRQFVVPE